MGEGRIFAIGSGDLTLSIRHPMAMSEIPLYIGPSPTGGMPLYINANQNRTASGLPRLFIKNGNLDNNLNLHLGVAFGRTTANLPYLFTSGVFNSGVIGKPTLFIGEESQTKTDVSLYLANDRLSIPYLWGDKGADSALNSNVKYPSGLLTMPLRISAYENFFVQSSGSLGPPMFMQGPLKAPTPGLTSLYITTIIPFTGGFGGYVYDNAGPSGVVRPLPNDNAPPSTAYWFEKYLQTVRGKEDFNATHGPQFTLSLQGNNFATGTFNYNTLDPPPGPGMTLKIGSSTHNSGLAPLYLEHAFGGLAPLYTEGMVPASGLHTLNIEAASGNNNANISLNIQSPTTGVIPIFVKGFRE